ncbi:MAG: T9SS type A sorting domain-containing protein [Flavobacteriales bacterium]|nr:T9SS type A sorting domain-containing protein [Flavobacteriales bacterium]
MLLRNLSLTQSHLAVNAQNLFNLVYDEDIFAYAEPLNTGNNLRKGREPIAPEKNKAAALLKCYPNPFTGSTQIEISLAEEESAVLQITDVTGKILIEEKVIGKAIVILSENEFLPGIYLCRLLQNGRLLAKDKLVKVN